VGSPKKALFASKNAFPALRLQYATICFSAKEYGKLYLFMGRANKNEANPASR
jgi:hypothetical protein